MDLFSRQRPDTGAAWRQPLPRYIWHPDEAVYYEQPRNGFCFFRREFQLASPPATASLRVLADTRYVLWLNGMELGRGPARFDPRAAMYDEYDLAEQLQAGPNVIGVYVLHHGYGTGAQAAILQCLLAQLVVTDAAGAETVISTGDPDWRALISPVHDRSARRLNGRQGPIEVQDVAAWPTGWLAPGYDASAAGWARAARSHPGTVMGNGPYWNLAPRDIPMLARGRQEVASVTPLGWAERPTPTVRELGSLPSADGLQAGEPPADCATPARLLALDFGRISCGYLELTIETDGPLTLDAYYAEELVRGRMVGGHGSRDFCDRWVVPAGRHELRVYFGWKTYRHVNLWVYGGAQLTLASVWIRTVGYPLPAMPVPVCPDEPRLPAITELADHTLRLCMQDGFLDSASREQQQWMGDGERQAYAAWHVYGPAMQPLWRRMLRQIAQSQDWTGAMMPRHPGRHENVSPIPYFMLSWVTSLADYRRLTGDTSLVRELWPNLRQCLRWFTAYADPAQDGLLRDVPHWMYIDWGNRPVGPMPDVNRGGVVTALNLKYLQALDVAQLLAHELDDLDASDAYSRLSSRLKAAIRAHCWSVERGAFVDSVVGGELSASISEITNGLALDILWHLSEDERGSIVEQVFENPADDVVWMSPAMVLELGQGLGAVGRADLALRILCDRFGDMLEAGATAMWEMWQLHDGGPEVHEIASASHGWGAGILGFLAEHVAGVDVETDAAPILRPALNVCREFAWTVATREGGVSLRWKHDGEAGEFWAGMADGSPLVMVPPADWQVTHTDEQGYWRLQRR